MATTNNTQQYLTIRETCVETGLPQSFLRRGCKNGTIAHIKSGNKYYVDVFALRNAATRAQPVAEM